MPHQNADIKRLPTGRVNFSAIRKASMLYVDKTRYVSQIAESWEPIFLARPRRFGKSLLVSTLESLFSKGLEDFHGLDIEKIWNDTTYKVVHLDFSRLAGKTGKDFTTALNDLLVFMFGSNNKIPVSEEQIKNLSPDTILYKIAEHLQDNSTVLLIDEYNAPLTRHMADKNTLNDLTQILADFYATVKQYVDKFRHIFITGVTRIAHVSIFSAFNNLKDISLEKDYAMLLGFTQEEIENNFATHVENAAHVLGWSQENILTALKDRYDGYRFSLDAPGTVYAPWSVLNFFTNPALGFENYWFESGGTPSLLLNFIKMHKSFTLRESAKQKFSTTLVDLKAKYEIPEIPPEILFTQAGYLTLLPKSQTRADLVFPNTEVAESMLQLALSVEGMRISDDTSYDCDRLVEYIDTRNLDKIIDIFNRILVDCSSSKSVIFTDELSVRDLIFAAIPQTSALLKSKERANALGISDLELTTRHTHMVIEFKRTYPPKSPGDKGRDAEKSLALGIAQMISRKYGMKFPDLPLYRLVMVIGTCERQLLPEFCREVREG